MKKAAKKVNFELIADTSSEPYRLMDEIRGKFHGDIKDAKIALAWRLRLKADPDGHLILGKCIKVSDLHKEFADFDFIILLNREVWQSIEFSRDKQLALLDHELCHAAVAYDDETGEKKVDDRGRTCFRIRKHDIEEFQDIVSRHGCYKRDLERFAEAMLKKNREPLFSEEMTVQIGVHGEDGKMKYSDPIPSSTFGKIAEQMGKH